MPKRRGRPVDPSAGVRRHLIYWWMCELTTVRVLPFPADAAQKARTFRQGSKSEYLPELAAAKIMADVSRVPRERRVIRRADPVGMPDEFNKAVRDLNLPVKYARTDSLLPILRRQIRQKHLSGYPAEVVNDILERVAGLAAHVPDKLTVAAIRKGYRQYYRENGWPFPSA